MFSFQNVDPIRRQSSWASCEFSTQRINSTVESRRRSVLGITFETTHIAGHLMINIHARIRRRTNPQRTVGFSRSTGFHPAPVLHAFTSHSHATSPVLHSRHAEFYRPLGRHFWIPSHAFRPTYGTLNQPVHRLSVSPANTRMHYFKSVGYFCDLWNSAAGAQNTC